MYFVSKPDDRLLAMVMNYVWSMLVGNFLTSFLAFTFMNPFTDTPVQKLLFADKPSFILYDLIFEWF